LRDAGVDPDRLERLTNLTMADNLEALRKGDLDLARLFEPYASIISRAAQAGSSTRRTARANRLYGLPRYPRQHRPQSYSVCRNGARGSLGCKNTVSTSSLPGLRRSTLVFRATCC
jgi:hypothetical protein